MWSGFKSYGGAVTLVLSLVFTSWGTEFGVGQLALAFGALAWGTTGFLTGDWALASLNSITFSLSLRGYYKWAPTPLVTFSNRTLVDTGNTWRGYNA